ncbi:hypothetical protein TRVA0_016S00474 [Trichomonascus vanleenenianus]|uniref:uncharacterized protein n=1 Tax=Trichomonascus vanleenenianus TaxID=2268995 RepID=UPI003ECB46CB
MSVDLDGMPTGASRQTPAPFSKPKFYQKLENNRIVSRQITEIINFKLFTPSLSPTGAKVKWFKEIIAKLQTVFIVERNVKAFLKDDKFVEFFLNLAPDSIFLLEKHLKAQSNQMLKDSSDDTELSIQALVDKLTSQEQESSSETLTGDELYQRVDSILMLTDQGGEPGKSLLDSFKKKNAKVEVMEQIFAKLYCHCWYFRRGTEVITQALQKVDCEIYPDEIFGLLIQDIEFATKDTKESVATITRKILEFIHDTDASRLPAKDLINKIEEMRDYFTDADFQMATTNYMFIHYSFKVLRKLYLVLDDVNGEVHQLGQLWKVITDDTKSQVSNPYLEETEIGNCLFELLTHASERL